MLLNIMKANYGFVCRIHRLPLPSPPDLKNQTKSLMWGRRSLVWLPCHSARGCLIMLLIEMWSADKTQLLPL